MKQKILGRRRLALLKLTSENLVGVIMWTILSLEITSILVYVVDASFLINMYEMNVVIRMN